MFMHDRGDYKQGIKVLKLTEERLAIRFGMGRGAETTGGRE